MNGKLVFLDLDGTVWDWHGVIPESAKEALRKLRENGHMPIICSGRSKGHIPCDMLYGLGFTGLIAACGIHVEVDSEIIYEKCLEPKLVHEIIRLSDLYKVPIVLEGPEYHFLSRNGFDNDQFVDRMLIELGDTALHLDEYTDNVKINKFAGDILQCSDYEAFQDGLKDRLSFIDHGTTYNENDGQEDDPLRMLSVFECVPYGTGKDEGILKMCEHFGIDPKDAYAVGDSNNDLEMIGCVGTGIAMGNGSQAIKDASDYVTDALENDGLLKAMKHFGLI